jgi:hypothetical protein
VARLLLAVELCLTVFVAAIAYVAPNSGTRVFQIVERGFSRLARRPWLSILAVGLAALIGRLAVLPLLPIPYPVIHDEFSHLLAADTFAHGRLTNPAHPMWTRFESFHIIQQPSYMSMYYPGQGMFLAAGQVLFGHPFWGVLLSVSVMCGAICWMLQGWMPGRWALAGGFLAVVRLAVFSYWASSYHGGALPAIGGALAMGALPRLRRRPTVAMALVMAVGMSVIGATRPFEGIFFGLPIAVALAVWMFGKHAPPFRVSLVRFVLPCGAAIGAAVLFLAWYFWRVTGNPVVIPYQVAIKTYGLMYFPWEEFKGLPQFRHAAMESFYADLSLSQYYEALAHPYIKGFLSLALPWLFFLGPLLTLPVVASVFLNPYGCVRVFAGRKMRFFALVILVSSIPWILPVYLPQPHYAAACTAVFYAIVMESMRAVRRWRLADGRPAGTTFLSAMSIAAVLLLFLRAAVPALGVPVHAPNPRSEFLRTWFSPQPDLPERARAEAYLKAQPGKQLVIVRYRSDHDPVFHEWVYNDALIDQAPVVWAREMTAEENEELISYFRDRTVWLAEPDETPPRLSPYR